MSIHYGKITTKPETCHNCGDEIEIGRGQHVEEWGYPWDGSDTEGSITEKLDEWYVHFQGVECLRAACACGCNMQYLRDVATGRDRVDGQDAWGKQWRDMARAAYNAHAKSNRELAEMIARGEEGAMREAGWGVIGGPARNGD